MTTSLPTWATVLTCALLAVLLVGKAFAVRSDVRKYRHRQAADGGERR